MQRRKQPQSLARIRVAGVGSGGGSAVNRLIEAGVYGVDFLAIDTDISSLCKSSAPLHIRIGIEAAAGAGTGGSNLRGKKAALESADAIRNALHGSDLVFLVAGLGGGTGTGATPVVAQVAKQEGAMVIGIVTYPFPFEGKKRTSNARKGIAELKSIADTLIVIPNDRLLKLANGTIGFHETYELAHDIWYQSIQGISELLSRSGLINVDFADVRSIMSEGGAAVIATGRASGDNRARRAAEQAANSNLLGVTIDGAHGVLLNVTGGPDMSLFEVEEAARFITSRVHSEANVIFGAAIDETLEEEVCITVIVTGFGFAGSKANLRTTSGKPVWKPEPQPLQASSQ